VYVVICGGAHMTYISYGRLKSARTRMQALERARRPELPPPPITTTATRTPAVAPVDKCTRQPRPNASSLSLALGTPETCPGGTICSEVLDFPLRYGHIPWPRGLSTVTQICTTSAIIHHHGNGADHLAVPSQLHGPLDVLIAGRPRNFSASCLPW